MAGGRDGPKITNVIVGNHIRDRERLGSDPSAQRITDPERVFDIWWAAFRQQYNVGGYLNVCMHPFQSGRALRIAMLARLIARMKTLPGVWFPTCEQVARHCPGGGPGGDTRFADPADAPLVQFPGTGVIFKICPSR
jgi:hypothetical protein